MSPFRSKYSILFAPALCLALLFGAGWVQRDLAGAEAFEPFHARAKAAIEAIPLQMEDWNGEERKPEPSAVQILKPNIIRSFILKNTSPAAIRQPDQRVFMTVVQCKRAVDMMGHNPPNCYPAIGDTLRATRPRTWDVDGLQITGTEYEFERLVDGRTRRRVVYCFLVVPTKGIVRDMKALEAAADDYQQRYYGAAQFQVVFDAMLGQGMSETRRDEVFTTLMRHAAGAIRELAAGEADLKAPRASGGR